ncbi:hypothetical protein [Photorhabdus laumondii]|nr:hypothetical protein [Photorhabdus laumondii]
MFYTLWISRCIAAARERIPGSIYPMDFKMHRDGKGVNPWEHR